MKALRLIRVSCLVAFGISQASTAFGALVTVSYEAPVVSEQTRNGSPSLVPIGTVVRGTLTYDTSTLASPIDSGRARYGGAVVSHQFEVLGMTFSQAVHADVFIDNNSVSNIDGFQTANGRFASLPSLGGLTLTGVNVSFQDPTQTVFDSTALPLTLNPNDFGIVRGAFNFENLGADQVSIYSFENGRILVPEPAGWAIAAAGALAAITTRRRRLA